MSNVIEQIQNSSFLYDQPWFYNNKLALRCELGIGDGKEYMKNSVCRSIQIANVLFENKKIDAAFYHLYNHRHIRLYLELWPVHPLVSLRFQ